MSYGNWIIGTLILWVLHAFGTMPLARMWTKRRHKEGAIEVLPKEGDETSSGIEEEKKEMAIPTGIYIFSDVIVMGIAGFLIGLLTKNFFIGISVRTIDWPGMIIFILSSLLGSSL